MPRMTVTLIARTKTVRSSRRIAHTAYWQVNELRISRIVAGPTNGRILSVSVNCSGGHCAAFARMLK